MAGVQASALLGSFLSEHEEKIVRRVERDLKWSLDQSPSREEVKRSIAASASVLASLLLERGDEGSRLWAEAVRTQGRAYLQARREPGDLVREFGALHRAIVVEWEKRAGPMGPDVSTLLSESITEGCSAAVSDYTRHMRGQQSEFRESALVHTLLENLDEGLLLFEADGTFSFATKPAFTLLGGRVHGALGRKMTDPSMQSLLTELGARSMDGAAVGVDDLPVAKTLKTREPAGPFLVQVRNGASGSVLELGSVPIWDDEARREGRFVLRGAIGTVRDRTMEARRAQELKEAHRELSELHARLLHRSRAQAMGELASGAAHALNNLLNAMHLRLRLLRENPGSEQVDALERAVDDTAKLVAWLQQFASQRTAGPVEVVDLDNVVRDALALVRPEARRSGEGGVRLHFQAGGATPIRGNPAELREILVSLLLYVRDQLAAGGQLTVTTDASSGDIVCRMRFRADVGAPARPEEWFGAPTESRGAASLALAAMTAREMLARWGGGLEAHSLEDGSAEFVLTFAPAQATTVIAARQVPQETFHRHVLVIDDDEDNASMLAEVLAAEGHHTDTAGTGKDAIEKWNRGPFDVALVDLLMPDLPGTEIAAALRKARPGAQIALVTGWELDEEQRRAAPVEAVFRKPVDLAQLLQFLAPEGQPAAPMA